MREDDLNAFIFYHIVNKANIPINYFIPDITGNGLEIFVLGINSCLRRERTDIFDNSLMQAFGMNNGIIVDIQSGGNIHFQLTAVFGQGN